MRSLLPARLFVLKITHEDGESARLDEVVEAIECGGRGLGGGGRR